MHSMSVGITIMMLVRSAGSFETVVTVVPVSLMIAGSSPAETPCVRKLGMFECKGIINFESLRF